MRGGQQLPVGRPIAWSGEDASAQVRDKSGTFGAEQVSASARDLARVGRRRLEVLERQLGPRDWQVLRSVAAHRFLTTRQIERLHFFDHASALSGARTARRVLRRLHEDRLLDPLKRRIGGVRAGSAAHVWRIGPAGYRLLSRAADAADARRPPSEPGLRTLEHCLAVADVHLSLVEAARRSQLSISRVEVEPAAWRPYLGPSGERLVLKPDLFVVTAIGEYEDHWFIEVDRGTETLPTLLRQCERYERYRRSGQEQAVSGIFPLVVWVVPTRQRQERLLRALTRPKLDSRLYRVVLPEELVGLVTGARP